MAKVALLCALLAIFATYVSSWADIGHVLVAEVCLLHGYVLRHA
jgi:hypothetical protein